MLFSFQKIFESIRDLDSVAWQEELKSSRTSPQIWLSQLDAMLRERRQRSFHLNTDVKPTHAPRVQAFSPGALYPTPSALRPWPLGPLALGPSLGLALRPRPWIPGLRPSTPGPSRDFHPPSPCLPPPAWTQTQLQQDCSLDLLTRPPFHTALCSLPRGV